MSDNAQYNATTGIKDGTSADIMAMQQLRAQLDQWAAELGFQQVGVTDIDLAEAGEGLQDWLAKGYHGNMDYMAAHDDMRWHPEKLHPGTVRVISARMNYLPPGVDQVEQLRNPDKAYISRYSLGRDYHKLVRKRLTQLGNKLREAAGAMDFRAFVDSAPIMERPLAQKAGLGWTGKHTLIINRKAGSYFFLGEILTDLPLPVDQPYEKNHCARCTSCLDLCPTDAFTGPYELDARKCISYLTIELKGPIPEALREPMGNRIFGCDDCQMVCPWNRISDTSEEEDFSPRHQLDKAGLLELFAWDEATFLKKTEGMPIRRTGYENWLRNIAVGLGNAPASLEVIDALQKKRPLVSDMVQEHIDWALTRQQATPI